MWFFLESFFSFDHSYFSFLYIEKKYIKNILLAFPLCFKNYLKLYEYFMNKYFYTLYFYNLYFKYKNKHIVYLVFFLRIFFIRFFFIKTFSIRITRNLFVLIFPTWDFILAFGYFSLCTGSLSNSFLMLFLTFSKFHYVFLIIHHFSTKKTCTQFYQSLFYMHSFLGKIHIKV